MVRDVGGVYGAPWTGACIFWLGYANTNRTALHHARVWSAPEEFIRMFIGLMTHKVGLIVLQERAVP